MATKVSVVYLDDTWGKSDSVRDEEDLELYLKRINDPQYVHTE